MKIKAIIIDDELRARTLLERMLIDYCPDVQVVDMCENLPNGIKSIHKLKPHIVFLDIEMPGHSGLEILDFFSEDEINFSIIFTTAYHQHAIKAFKYAAVDYLLKPIEPKDLENSIELYKKRIKENLSISHKEDTENLALNFINRITVPIGNSMKMIDLDTVYYIRADNTYCEIIFSDKTKLIVSRTLKNFEDALGNHPHFYRCHKSYIVNILYVVELVKSEGGYLVMKNNEHILISSDKVNEFLAKSIVIKRL